MNDKPIGKFAKFTDGIWREVTDGSPGMPLYTTPPKSEWVGLTDEEIRDLWSWSATAKAECVATTQQHAFARAIEVKLKEKNT